VDNGSDDAFIAVQTSFTNSASSFLQLLHDLSHTGWTFHAVAGLLRWRSHRAQKSWTFYTVAELLALSFFTNSTSLTDSSALTKSTSTIVALQHLLDASTLARFIIFAPCTKIRTKSSTPNRIDPHRVEWIRTKSSAPCCPVASELRV
jgi:hypothetical protein